MKRYYIAYGSNLNVPQMRWRCPDARIIGTGLPTEDYYRVCLEGYRTFGFDERYLIDAVKRSREMMR